MHANTSRMACEFQASGARPECLVMHLLPSIGTARLTMWRVNKMFLFTMSCTKRRASKCPLSGCMLTRAAHLASLSTGVGCAGMGGSLRASSSSSVSAALAG